MNREASSRRTSDGSAATGVPRIVGHPREWEHARHLPPDRGRHEQPLASDLLETLDHSLDHDPECVRDLSTIEHVFAGLERNSLAVLAEPIQLLVRETLENVQGPQLVSREAHVRALERIGLYSMFTVRRESDA